MVSRLAPKCNTEQFGHFLEDVAHAYEGRQIIMFLDGAGWHKAKALNIPPHMRLEFLPPYTPECNPVEHVWDEVREKGFANRLFATLDDVEARLKTEPALLAESLEQLGQLTWFTWLRHCYYIFECKWYESVYRDDVRRMLRLSVSKACRPRASVPWYPSNRSIPCHSGRALWESAR